MDQLVETAFELASCYGALESLGKILKRLPQAIQKVIFQNLLYLFFTNSWEGKTCSDPAALLNWSTLLKDLLESKILGG